MFNYFEFDMWLNMLFMLFVLIFILEKIIFDDYLLNGFIVFYLKGEDVVKGLIEFYLEDKGGMKESSVF